MSWEDILKKKPKSARSRALERAKKKGLKGLNKPQRLKDDSGKTNQTAGQRSTFKSRHAKNIKRGKMSAAYWANKVKWSASKTKEPKNKKWRKGS